MKSVDILKMTSASTIQVISAPAGQPPHAVGQRVYNKGGKTAKAVVTMDGNVGQRNNDSWFNDGGDDLLKFSDMYLTTTGFIPGVPEANLSIGRHALQQYELQMLDWKAHKENSASGVGVENLPVGTGKLDIALNRQDLRNCVRSANCNLTDDVNTLVYSQGNNLYDYNTLSGTCGGDH